MSYQKYLSGLNKKCCKAGDTTNTEYCFGHLENGGNLATVCHASMPSLASLHSGAEAGDTELEAPLLLRTPEQQSRTQPFKLEKPGLVHHHEDGQLKVYESGHSKDVEDDSGSIHGDIDEATLENTRILLKQLNKSEIILKPMRTNTPHPPPAPSSPAAQERGLCYSRAKAKVRTASCSQNKSQSGNSKPEDETEDASEHITKTKTKPKQNKKPEQRTTESTVIGSKYLNPGHGTSSSTPSHEDSGLHSNVAGLQPEHPAHLPRRVEGAEQEGRVSMCNLKLVRLEGLEEGGGEGRQQAPRRIQRKVTTAAPRLAAAEEPVRVQCQVQLETNLGNAHFKRNP